MIVIAVILTVITVACKKDILSEKRYLNYEFTVGDQVNVDKYEIEVSTDSKIYESVGLIWPITNESEPTYSIKIDVTRFFKNTNMIYTRLKAVDKDGSITYYKNIGMIKNIR
jgi:hypothetical protein